MMLFNRLHDDTKPVLANAYRAAQARSHDRVTSEHLLLALLENSVCVQALNRLSVNVETLRTRLDAIFVTGSADEVQIRGAAQYSIQVFVTPRMKRILDLATEEAGSFGDPFISPEHLLLALLREQDTALARLLAEYGITHDRVQEIVTSLRNSPPFVKN